MATSTFERVAEGLRRNVESKTIYANFRFKGKLYRTSLDTPDKVIARNRLAALRKKIEAGKEGQKDILIKDALPHFLGVSRTKASNTQDRYRYFLNEFVEDFGTVNPRDVKPMGLDSWLTGIKEERELANSTFNKYSQTLNVFFTFLLRNDFIEENPMEDYETMANNRKPTFVPSMKQVAAIIKHLRNRGEFWSKHESVDCVEYLALSGQGKAEMNNAEWKDVLWDENLLLCFRSKTGKPHVCYLFPALKELLAKRYEKSDKNPDGKIFIQKSVHKSIASACEALGIPHFGHHGLRRFFISQRIEEKISPSVIAGWVGHRDGGKMIFTTYCRHNNEFAIEQAKLVKRIG